jgi:hypothetical protein
MMTNTENGEIAYSTSGSSLVDLFYSCIRDTSNSKNNNEQKLDFFYVHNNNIENYPSYNKLKELFLTSYGNDPVNTLKCIFYTRDCREGKGERIITFILLKVLYDNFPDIYHANVFTLAKKYGRFYDIINMSEIIGLENADIEITGIAQQLQSDYENYELLSNNSTSTSTSIQISLCAKWIPSQTCNRHKVFYKLLRNKLFPNIYNSDEIYRKMISQLREHLKIVERYMSLNLWDNINFSHVPASAMKIYGKGKDKNGAFYRHCNDRFIQYLNDVKEGKSKINSTGISPYKLVSKYMENSEEDIYDDVVELQWKDMINKLKNTKNIDTLKNSYAIVDVSGSMYGIPLQVAISLGLVINEISGNDILTFSQVPEWHKIKGNTLKEKVESLNGAKWGANTNFNAVYELIYNYKCKVLEDKVDKGNIKADSYLFVFSDMQFDEAYGNNNERKPMYEYYKDKFESIGLKLPKIVFWNLRAVENIACPVSVDSNGTALVSGFSEQLLKAFLSGNEFTPLSIVLNCISKYDVVYF